MCVTACVISMSVTESLWISTFVTFCADIHVGYCVRIEILVCYCECMWMCMCVTVCLDMYVC